MLPDTLIAPPNAPDVPGLRFRRFRGPEDYPAMTVIGNDSRAADGSDWTLTVEDVARLYDHLDNSDPATDMIVAEVDGEMVGLSRVEWLREEAGLYRYSFSLNVHPAWRGYGIRRAILRWVEARGREIAAGHPADAPKAFVTHAYDHNADLIALLEEESYQPVRYYHTMTRSLATSLPDFAMPAGLELRAVRPEHYRLIWDAAEEAWRDHWGYSPNSESAYEEWQLDSIIFQPTLWQVAWDIEKDEVAGQIRTFIDTPENERFGRQRGYTEFITVRRPYRRRGLARALIAESLRVLKARGMTESALMVDSESLTGATRLYEACGFTTINRAAIYHKPLDGIFPTGA